MSQSKRNPSPPNAQPPAVPPRPDGTPETLLWDWSTVVSRTGLARRTIERELAGGRFPEPVRRVGRRPYWKPGDIISWAEGSR